MNINKNKFNKCKMWGTEIREIKVYQNIRTIGIELKVTYMKIGPNCYQKITKGRKHLDVILRL